MRQYTGNDLKEEASPLYDKNSDNQNVITKSDCPGINLPYSEFQKLISFYPKNCWFEVWHIMFKQPVGAHTIILSKRDVQKWHLMVKRWEHGNTKAVACNGTLTSISR